MTKLKIILFSIGLILSIYQMILKYMENKQKPKLYHFVFPLLMLFLLIENIRKL
jgi:hypothetical protein